MPLNLQKTISNSISCTGVGLHNGINTKMTFLPAKENTGIIFKRTDIQDRPNEVKASYEFVSNTVLNTTLKSNDGVEISTVEHLMAALWGCNIDNIIVEIDGPEVPIMDGSSEPFVFMLECAGIIELSKKRIIIEILKEIDIKEGDAFISVTPAEEFSINMEIDFENSVISKQQCIFDSSNVSFKKTLCRARTFGFAHEVEKLRSMGLARGGSLDNAIVISDNKILNNDGLRYKDEFVRHKVLDSIGDFYLAGGYIKGHFQAKRSGHALNNKFLRKLFATKDAWRFVSIDNLSLPDIAA